MGCQTCSSHWFWKKIGRCVRCMIQLSILSLLFWPVWIFWGSHQPKSIGSITLLLFGAACHGLLLLHLLMKFIILPFKK
ncbi:DUF3624 domain-containing protein [Vibrio sp.]|nr:DUF3624 domain-containing protein [Vibrio sp.]